MVNYIVKDNQTFINVLDLKYKITETEKNVLKGTYKKEDASW